MGPPEILTEVPTGLYQRQVTVATDPHAESDRVTARAAVGEEDRRGHDQGLAELADEQADDRAAPGERGVAVDPAHMGVEPILAVPVTGAYEYDRRSALGGGCRVPSAERRGPVGVPPTLPFAVSQQKFRVLPD